MQILWWSAFWGFKIEQLNRVVEKRGLGGPENVIIHVSKMVEK
jgi:hypothetical protein